MKEFRSIDEILDFAINREIEANRFYMDLADRMQNESMCKVFENFAREELGHKTKLESLKADKITTSTQNVPDLKIAAYVVDIEPQPDMDYQNALILAMQKEKAAFHLYIDLAEVVENQVQRETFLSLAQEEARHKLCFEIEYDDMVFKED